MYYKAIYAIIGHGSHCKIQESLFFLIVKHDRILKLIAIRGTVPVNQMDVVQVVLKTPCAHPAIFAKTAMIVCVVEITISLT